LGSGAVFGTSPIASRRTVFANLAVASAMLNTLWLYLCGASHYSELVFDIAQGLMPPVRLAAPKFSPSARAGKKI
jgi:hypothetical protein